MTFVVVIPIFALGLLAGAVIGIVIWKRIATADAARLVAEAQGASQAREAALEARAEAVTQAHLQSQAQLREMAQALSAEALARNNEAFLQLAQNELVKTQMTVEMSLQQKEAAITALLTPIRDGLEKYDGKLQEIERARTETFGMMAQRLEAVQAVSESVRAETQHLIHALKAPNVRGQWGEVQLKRVCELAGMLEHCDFTTQHQVDTGDGRLRPDLVVHLAGGKTIVVDAKTPLQAYMAAMDASDDTARRILLQEHARHLCQHVDALSKKAYWDQFADTPELVVLFLPTESLFSAALEHEPHLIENAVEQRVLIATPTTLIALLKALAYGWRQERLAQHASEISTLGKELYDRLRTFGDHFGDVGIALSRSVEAYNKAVGSIESRVLVSARKFRTLHAATGDDIALVEPIDEIPRTLAAVELVSEKKLPAY